MRPDVQRLLDTAFDHAIAEYGKRGYQFWEQLIGDQINLKHPDDSSVDVEIMPIRYGKKDDKRILVMVSIPHHSLLQVFTREPSKCFLVKPDGSVENI